MFFEITGTDAHTRARLGRLETTRGAVITPAFMPVGTVGSVKSLDPTDLKMMGFELILSNAYHLALRPGHQTVEKLGGLHRFMGWEKSILTDSGGFQIFSLATLRSLSDEGVEFSSHLDGTRMSLTPDRCLEIQRALGSDLVMPLDDCPPYPAEPARLEDSVRRTTLWARKSRKAGLGPGQRLFGIVQGGMVHALRKKSAEEISELQFDGHALGGVGVGEPTALGQEIVSATIGFLPERAPRYVMGIGTPHQIVDMIGEGVDLFDCVLPTRNARNGTLFTTRGRINIKRQEYLEDSESLDPGCACPTCRGFSRGYLRHLFQSRELLSYRLNSIHNLSYYASVMTRAREAIKAGKYAQFRRLPEFESMRGDSMNGDRGEP